MGRPSGGLLGIEGEEESQGHRSPQKKFGGLHLSRLRPIHFLDITGVILDRKFSTRHPTQEISSEETVLFHQLNPIKSPECFAIPSTRQY